MLSAPISLKLYVADLRITTDDVGPLTEETVVPKQTVHVVLEKEQNGEENKSPRKSSRKHKSSPISKSVKKGRGKVKETMKSKESAEFQEIMQEAEIIAASINQVMGEDNTNSTEPIVVKVEHDPDFEPDDNNEYDEHSDEAEDIAASTSNANESANTSTEPSAATTPVSAKKRKLDSNGSSPGTSKGAAKVSTYHIVIDLTLVMLNKLRCHTHF